MAAELRYVRHVKDDTVAGAMGLHHFGIALNVQGSSVTCRRYGLLDMCTIGVCVEALTPSVVGVEWLLQWVVH